jgi:uncharacterized protein YdhG (YjbR/CyaY superfamily)
MPTRPSTIDQYIASAPKEAQAKLRQLRACILSGAPKAIEAIKWGNPTFSYKRILVAVAAYKDHINFMPTPSVVRAFSKDLTKFKTGKGSVQFPYDKPLPLMLIRKMTKFRVMESLEKDKKWM